MKMEEFNNISKELTKALSKEEKKSNGIFFTPKTYRDIILDKVKEYKVTNDSLQVLEPSFGSGEFITDILNIYPTATITGVEISEQMFSAFQDTVAEKTNVLLYNQDFIEFNTNILYDIIIGNPPYVVIKSKNVPQIFKTITTGRPNLYCWFLFKCIGLLKENGLLAFVIPNSMLNTAYYESLRKYIHNECEILEIVLMKNKKFMETDQDTIGFVLRRMSNNTNTRYVVKYRERILFSVYYKYLQERLEQSKTLTELGFGVKTGSIVWNQVKDNLTTDETKGTLLIYTSNIKNGSFERLKPSKDKEKKQYVISTKVKDKGPVILINRGYGNTSYNFTIMLIEDTVDDKKEFYVENHLNVVYPITDEAKNNIKLVYNYLVSEKNREYITKFTGNGAMSKTEIETLLPISLEAS
jgi:adenine-specific DNA-methyltransferase